MTSPKFQIGDVVAVFCMEDGAIIAYPQTEVVSMEFINVDEVRVDVSGKEFVSVVDGWAYEVAAELGTNYAEGCLRRINPDTEYLTDSAPQKLETAL